MWNCGCNIFGCNCGYEPHPDRCYYRSIIVHPGTNYPECTWDGEMAADRKKAEILPIGLGKTLDPKKLIKRP